MILEKHFELQHKREDNIKREIENNNLLFKNDKTAILNDRYMIIFNFLLILGFGLLIYLIIDKIDSAFITLSLAFIIIVFSFQREIRSLIISLLKKILKN